MHVAIPILPPQKKQAERLLERIANLGGVSQFPALIVSAGEMDLAPLHKLAASAFQKVTLLPIEIPQDHPNPANILFQRTAFHLGETIGDAYLYLEPGSWPISANWFKDLVSAYREHNHRFMGKLALLSDGTGEYYMLPTAIYPKDFHAKSDLIRQVPLNKSAAEFLQGEIVYRGKAHDSGLFVRYGEDDRNASLVLMWEPLRTAEREAELEYVAGNSLDTLNEPTPTVAGAFASVIAKTFPDGPPAAGYLSSSEVTFPHNARQIAKDLQTNLNEMREAPEIGVPQTYAASDTLASDVVSPIERWINDPQTFSPNVEIPVPINALVPEAVIPVEMLQPGTLDPFPQPVPELNTVTEGGATHVVAVEPAEVYESEIERNIAIKADQGSGMGWKSLLSKYKLSPKVMSKILNEV